MKALTSKARIILLAIWITSFFCNIGSVFYIYLRGWIESDNFGKALSEINSLYVTYIGAIVAFYLVPSTRMRAKQAEPIAFALAATTSVLWNISIMMVFAGLIMGSGTIEQALQDVHAFGPLFSWLVAPAIGYFFGSTIGSHQKLPTLKK